MLALWEYYWGDWASVAEPIEVEARTPAGVGRGALGLADRHMLFRDLIDDPAADRRPILDLLPAYLLTTWTLQTGAVWKANILQVRDDVYRDVASLESNVRPYVMTRVERLSDCVATPGTYFAVVPDAQPKLGVSLGYIAASVFVHLPDGSNPNSASVYARLGFYHSVRGDVLPILGPQKLANGDFELWIEGMPESWTLSLPGGVTADEETSEVASGASSIRLSGSVPGRSGAAALQTVSQIAANAIYVASGYYRIDGTSAPGIQVRLGLGLASGPALLPDGRSFVGDVSGFPLRHEPDEWRAFAFYFTAPLETDAWVVRVSMYNASLGTASGTVWLDRFSLRRVWRFEHYEARIPPDSLPQVEARAASILFGPKTVGLGSVALLNGDGRPERALGGLFLENAPARVALGGRMPDGSRIDRSDWRAQFPGRSTSVSVDDHLVQIEIDDERARAHAQVPQNRRSVANEPDLEPEAEDSPRPLAFGSHSAHRIRAARVDLTAEGYGIYELVDSEIPLRDNIVVFGAGARSYPNEESADKDVLGLDLDPLLDFTVAVQNTRAQVLRDVRNLRYNRSAEDVGTGAAFDFDIGAGTLTALVDVAGVAAEAGPVIAAAMNTAASVADITVTYSETTHLFTVAKGAGTLNLLPKSGPNAHLKSWALLGFDTSADRTGSLSYLADEALFESADVDHVIRFSQGGFLDATTPVLTTVSQQPIDTPAVVVAWLLYYVLGVGLDKIDLAEMRAADQAQRDESLRVLAYLQERVASTDIFSRLERAGLMDVIVDGEGVWRFRNHLDASPTIAAQFFDRDYLSFRLTQRSVDAYRLVRVLYGRHPARGTWIRTFDANEDVGAVVKFVTQEILEVESWLSDLTAGMRTAAEEIGRRLHRLSAGSARVAEFSARAKLVDRLIGDRISLTRERALDPNGALTAVVFRIIALRHDLLSGITQCTAVEDVSFL